MIKLLSLWEVSHFESRRAKFRETSGEVSLERSFALAMFRTDASKSSRFDRASGRYYEPNVVVQQVHLVGGNPSDRNQPVVCPRLRYIADTSYLRHVKSVGGCWSCGDDMQDE